MVISTGPNEQVSEPGMNADELYREDSFTDQRTGVIRRLTPVTASGDPDPDRAVLYSGQAQMMTPAGALPLNFPIEAETLAQAVAGFSEAAQKAMQETIEELREMRRQSASSLVLPGESPRNGSNPADPRFIL